MESSVLLNLTRKVILNLSDLTRKLNLLRRKTEMLSKILANHESLLVTLRTITLIEISCENIELGYSQLFV